MSDLKGRKMVVLLAEMHEESEFWYPAIRLKEAGAEVIIAGKEAKTEYAGKSGLKAKSDVAYKDVSASGVDGVVIPGGFGPDFMRRSQECISLVREICNQGKLVAFICHAGWVPISAGIVKGKKVTSFPTLRDDLVNAGAKWEDSELVRDGNLISSRNPGDLPAFMKGILNYLAAER